MFDGITIDGMQMRRYGGDIKSAKQLILLFAMCILFLTLPLLWTAQTYSGILLNRLPFVWLYGLIICPILLVLFIGFAHKKFERLNR